MYSSRSILVCGILAGIVVLCSGAGDTGSPASQPANWKVTDDPNWIGPTSWQRHHTLGPFVETKHGLGVKSATSKPAQSSKVDYYAARSTRSAGSSSSTGTGTTATASTTGTKSTSTAVKSERSSSSRSSRAESRHSSRSSRSSSHSSRSSSSSSHSSRSY
jgi:hypothetical protein